MDAINPTHVLVVLTVVAVVYAVWAMYFISRDSRRADEKGSNSKLKSSPSEDRKPVSDVMGKSKFVLTRGVSLPQAATAAETEPDAKKANTFAPEKVPEHPRQIAPEELDEVFGKPPEGETNEPLDVEQPLYVEPPFPEEYADDDDGENEALPLRGRHPAGGVKYEELGEAYHRVVHNPTLTDTEKEETGRILLDLKPTDMFEYIVSGDPTRDNQVLYLIDTYLAAIQRRMSARETESPAPPSVAASSGFDIRDYV